MKITIEDLQKYLYERYGKFATEQGLFMKLVEEVGEVAEVLNVREGRKYAAQESGDLASELADVIHYAVAIAAINGINLSEAILAKDVAASAKYKHSTNLTEFISQNNK